MTSSREGGERLSHKGAAVTESGRVQQQGTEMDGLSDSSRQKPNTLGETQGWITGSINQSGCCNKIPSAGWCKQHLFLLAGKSKFKVLAHVFSDEGSLPGFLNRKQPVLSSQVEREASSYRDTNTVGKAAHLCDII